MEEKIVSELKKEVPPTRTHEILANFPLKAIVTTNYDHLLEKALSQKKRNVFKVVYGTEVPRIGADQLQLIKMHGDLNDPSTIVITKKDYDEYAEKHRALITHLLGLLITCNFLFVGFSLEDPNFDNIYTQIKTLFGKEKRTSFAIFKNPPPHEVRRLKNEMGIEVISVEDFAEIPHIFEELHAVCSQPYTQAALTPFERESVHTTFCEVVKRQNKWLDPRGIFQFEKMLTKKDVELEDVYVVPRLIKQIMTRKAKKGERREERGERREKLDPKEKELEEYVFEKEISLSLKDALSSAENTHMVILGEPGVGKTCLLRYIVLKTSTASELLGINPVLPVLIPLREYKEYGQTKTLREFISYYIKNRICNLSENFIESFLDENSFFFLFDGLDEVVSESERISISRQVEQFMSQYPHTRIILTSRPAGYRTAPLIGAIPHFTLAEFNDDEIKEFLVKWFTFLEEVEEGAYEKAVIEEKANKLAQIILKTERILCLARNPLLLTILVLIHRVGKKLPERRAEFYEYAVKTVAGTWDNWKKLYTDKKIPDDEVIISILEKVGFKLHSEKEENVVEVEELKTWVKEAMEEELGHSSREEVNNFVWMLNERAGLLVERGLGLYGFVHLTFQEYFAARYIAWGRGTSEAQKLIKEKLYFSRWREVFLLAAALAPPQLADIFKEVLRTEDPNNLENQARSLIVNQKYSEARPILEHVIELAPEREHSLQNEFGFLYDLSASAEQDKKLQNENRELVEWRKNLWFFLSEKNDFYLEEIEKGSQATLQEVGKTEAHDRTPDKVESAKVTEGPLGPYEKGKKLEEAVLHLFRQFFVIAEKQEETILKELRKQKQGLQFGFDISFECSVKGNEDVKCHIECKNLQKNEITLKDIADKIMQTEDDYPNIDHWILISPHSPPANDLHRRITSWNDEGKYHFEIQIWSPDKNIKEFFGLSPEIYDLIYEKEETEIHPSQWSEEKRLKVFKEWEEKLKPVIRLRKEWVNYLKKPIHMCMRGENGRELDILYRSHVSMRYMDERRNIMGQSLEKYVLEWLKDTTKRALLLLGEFGDGKTAFTYILSRNLADEFLKNPLTGWIPVRFALHDYYSAKDSQEFLQKRLAEFGADIASWNELKTRNNLLVILDGFDEMTKDLNPKTVKKNIISLRECCKEFQGLKILITSRIDFYKDQRLKKFFVQWIHSEACYLAPIDRQTNIKHLETVATSPEQRRKLERIRKLHDPIGLASKPLFLQMIKETLNELPEENLDEMTLYETYIEKSINRKIENLEDDESMCVPNELYPNLVKVMEKIALGIQESTENYFSLEEFENTNEENFASLLWRTVNSDDATECLAESNEEKAEDAKERVRIRSLLTQARLEDGAHKRPVDFCHRSMREYFVAKGICRALKEDIGRAKELLTKLPLNYEIRYFIAEIMKQENSRNYEKNLQELIQSTRKNNRSGYLGGHAVTLLYRLKGVLPGENWSGLNLDHADLSGADLSYKNFSLSSLRFSNLDNVNFEGADFSNCDLTEVKIEETALVLAVAAYPPQDRIIAAYGDNTIREWDITQKLKNETQIICRDTNSYINWMKIHSGSDLCAMTREEVIFYDFGEQGELSQRARFRIKSRYRRAVAKEDTLLLVSDKENQESEVLLVKLPQRTRIGSLKSERIELCENLDQEVFVLYEGKDFLRIIKKEDSSAEAAVTVKVHEVTSLCAFYCGQEDKYLLACGQRDGKILIWQIDVSKESLQETLLLESPVHDGLVSSLAFLNDFTVISGGTDRKIYVLRFGPEWGGIKGTKEQILHLTTRCKGMIIKGVKGEREYRMLEKLTKEK